MNRPTDFGILLDLVDFLTGKPRSLKEIMNEMCVDQRTGYRHLERLEDFGFEVEKKREGLRIKSYQIIGVPPAFKSKINSIHDKITIH